MGIAITPSCPVHKLVLAALVPMGALASLCEFLSIAGSPNADVDDGGNPSDLLWGDDAEGDEIFQVDAAFSIEGIQAALPSVFFENLVDFGSDRADCPICVSEISSSEEVRRAPCCRQIFHTACIDAWLRHRHRACPLCRAPFPSLNEDDEATERHALVVLL